MKKKLAVFLMILCMLAVLLPQQPMPVMAATTTADGKYEYTVNNDDTVTITKYKGSGTRQATVPNMIEGKPVTSIGEGAFFGCGGLTEIKLPDSVTSIGNEAFADCSGLTSIDIPEKVTSIGRCAFAGCGGLTSITIPENVTSIGVGAFKYCSGLTSIDIPEKVTSIGDRTFEGCGLLTSIKLPDSVTSIGEEAFSGCSRLTSIDIPKNVTSIGDSTFEGCGLLTSIKLPDSVTSIGEYAFYYCEGLTSIHIPKNVTSIGEYAFFSCSGLTSIDIPEKVTSIGKKAFKCCSGLTSITIPENVTSIGEEAFKDCSGLTSIHIPKNVTSIGDDAFDGCSQLKTVYYTGTEEGWNNISSKFQTGINRIYLLTPPKIKSKPYTGSLQKADVRTSPYYDVTKNEGGKDSGSYDVELTLKEPETYAWTTALTSASITLKFEITQATGGGTSTGSDSSYTPVNPQPVTETRIILVKDEKGNDVPVELTTTTHPDGTVTDAKAKLTRNGSRKKNQLTGLLSGVLIANIEKEAKTEDIELTITVKSGKKTYEVTASSKDLTAGAKLKVFVVDKKTGKLTLVSGKTYQADKAGNVKLTLPAGQNYRIMTVKEAKAIEKKITKSIRLKKKSVTLKKGKKYQIRLDSSVSTENIKSITYSSEDTSVATVSKSGKVTAKGKGNVTIKVKVTLKNGITKILKVQITVE